MQSMLSIDIPQLPNAINYNNNILLIGSCFTEHISDRLQHHKFKVLSNPHGILFNPLSVASSLDGYMSGKTYTHDDLFHLNELWNSWDHHTRFSDIDAEQALQNINRSQAAATEFINKADWLVITLGSAFQYYLKETGAPVANNHRAPAQWFEKRLLTVEDIVTKLSATLQDLFGLNPFVNVLFTISPVRHIRDGVIDNNRSKARLIEAVHTLCSQSDKAFYFPAYELVIDVLRDHRYYDIDLVHPNYPATTYVWEQFANSCISPSVRDTMQQVQEIMTAKSHRARFPQTEAHQRFKKTYMNKATELMKQHPYLDLNDEISYFSKRGY